MGIVIGFPTQCYKYWNISNKTYDLLIDITQKQIRTKKKKREGLNRNKRGGAPSEHVQLFKFKVKFRFKKLAL